MKLIEVAVMCSEVRRLYFDYVAIQVYIMKATGFLFYFQLVKLNKMRSIIVNNYTWTV